MFTLLLSPWLGHRNSVPGEKSPSQVVYSGLHMLLRPANSLAALFRLFTKSYQFDLQEVGWHT